MEISVVIPEKKELHAYCSENNIQTVFEARLLYMQIYFSPYAIIFCKNLYVSVLMSLSLSLSLPLSMPSQNE
jgi:hypothetical protein